MTASGTHTWMALSAAHGESPQVPRHNQQGPVHPPGAFAKVASRTVSCPRLPQASVVGAAWPRAAEGSQCCEAGDWAQPLPLAGLGFPTAERILCFEPLTLGVPNRRPRLPGPLVRHRPAPSVLILPSTFQLSTLPSTATSYACAST